MDSGVKISSLLGLGNEVVPMPAPPAKLSVVTPREVTTRYLSPIFSPITPQKSAINFARGEVGLQGPVIRGLAYIGLPGIPPSFGFFRN